MSEKGRARALCRKERHIVVRVLCPKYKEMPAGRKNGCGRKEMGFSQIGET